MKTTVKDHLYHGDNIPDHRGHDRCTVCHCPNRLPATPQAVREAEARRLGETEEPQPT